MDQKFNNRLSVVVRDINGALFDGSASAVSSINDKGKFDILVSHANFVTTLKDYVLVHSNNKNPFTVKLQRGIMRVKENRVEVFVGV